MTDRNFKHRTFQPASEAQIADVERRHGVRLCEDFRAFALTDNGWELEEFNQVEGGWPYELHRLFGVGPGADCSLDEVKQFFDPRFLPICYPVGEDGGGNLMTQVAAGERRGRIAMLDHEVFFGGMSALLDVADFRLPDDDGEGERLPFRSFAEATPDQILDICFENGYLCDYQMTFGEFLADFTTQLNAAAEAARHRPAPAPVYKITIGCVYGCIWRDGAFLAAEKLDPSCGDAFVLNEAEALAVEYRVKAGDAPEIDLEIRFEAPDGTTKRTPCRVVVGDTYQYRTFLSSGEALPQSGRYRFEIVAPNEPRIAPVGEAREISIGDAPFPFTAGVYRPARADEIDAFEADLPYRLCDDFRQWCLTHNGLDLRWRFLPLWDALTDERRRAFDAEIEALVKARWELAVSEIIGFRRSYQGFNPYIEPQIYEAHTGLAHQLSRNGPLGDDAAPHLKLIYPVAGAHDLGLKGYWQIAVGERRGRIVELLDYAFSLDDIAQVKDGRRTAGSGKSAKTHEYPFADIAQATPDQILDAWIAEGKVRPTDLTFASLSGRVIDAHSQEFMRLFDTYFQSRGEELSP